VAPEPVEKIEFHARQKRIILEKREYQSPEAGRYGLVISASNDSDINKLVYEDCREAGVLVNVVDDPQHCSFTFPAVIRRDCLAVAISTDGKAPFLSGHLRLVLENIFSEHWVKIAKWAAVFRTKVMARWPDNRSRKLACYSHFLEADWKVLLKDKDDEEIIRELDLWLEN
jgi:precorrin-2 dehydrogenase/sirohydrochlorin ferrochelatase